MNKDNAHLYLPLVQALAEGKTIQVNECMRWVDRRIVHFDLSPQSYRIKPEPLTREFYYVVDKSTCESIHGSVIYEYSNLKDAKKYIESMCFEKDYTIMHAKAVEVL